LKKYFFKTPKLLKNLYPNLIWDIKSTNNSLFLTFDDGPSPITTPFILKTLKKYDAMASFFCVGENIMRYKEVALSIVKAGHMIGNHTQNHLNGWKVKDKEYLQNVQKCNETLNSILNISNDYFRPPYGRIKASQVKLLNPNYKIIMWDYLTGDFDITLDKKMCVSKFKKSEIQSGSIIVFHDNPKAVEKLHYVLPRFLDHFNNIGFTFKKL